MRAAFQLFCVALALIAAPAHAERIKDLGSFDGVRSNQLTGYGVVVGLAGTGDDSLDYATQGVKGVVSRFGLVLPPGINPSLKNAAAVLVTAELPAFAKPGQRLDVTVSALGKAKSLRAARSSCCHYAEPMGRFTPWRREISRSAAWVSTPRTDRS